MLCTQQKQRTDKVIELHVEAERITDIIHPKHQRVRRAVDVAGLVTLEHLNFNVVENLQKEEEDVR